MSRVEGYTVRRFALLVVGVLAVVGLAACGESPAATGQPTTAGTPRVASVTDVAWAQLIVALDQRAMQVLDLIEQRGTEPRLVALASDLATGHRIEVDEISAELRRLGASGENPHAGHEMPGMASPTVLAALAHTTGDRFDQIAVEALRAHLDQCRTLAAGELASGSDHRMVDMARTVDATRKTQLEALARIPVARESLGLAR
jgi:uncharacterized protein (DUF305 family)